jgi:hypothetical protein
LYLHFIVSIRSRQWILRITSFPRVTEAFSNIFVIKETSLVCFSQTEHIYIYIGSKTLYIYINSCLVQFIRVTVSSGGGEGGLGIN